MKKVLIIMFLLTAAKENFAQLNITDTTAYLRDSISARREYYIGKPLSVLLNDLKIEVKSFMTVVPFDSEPDTIEFKVTSLDFFSNEVLFTRTNSNIVSPHMNIVFTAAIQIPKETFKPGNVLDWTTGWTPEKAAFFGDHVISDLQVIGL